MLCGCDTSSMQHSKQVHHIVCRVIVCRKSICCCPLYVKWACADCSSHCCYFSLLLFLIAHHARISVFLWCKCISLVNFQQPSQLITVVRDDAMWGAAKTTYAKQNHIIAHRLIVNVLQKWKTEMEKMPPIESTRSLGSVFAHSLSIACIKYEATCLLILCSW